MRRWQEHLGLSDVGVPLNYLVEGEKLWKNITIVFRSMGGARNVATPPLNLAKSVYLYPPEMELLEPDLVLLIVSPSQASRIVT